MFSRFVFGVLFAGMSEIDYFVQVFDAREKRLFALTVYVYICLKKNALKSISINYLSLLEVKRRLLSVNKSEWHLEMQPNFA